jgi:hypothetical protein
MTLIQESDLCEQAIERDIRTIRGDLACKMAEPGLTPEAIDRVVSVAKRLYDSGGDRELDRAGRLSLGLARFANEIVDREDRRKALSQPANNVFMGPTQINIEVSPARREDYARWIESAKPEEVKPDATPDRDTA